MLERTRPRLVEREGASPAAAAAAMVADLWIKTDRRLKNISVVES